MKNFAAIDFETANNCAESICSVGLVVVREGIIVDRFYSLVQPEPNYYLYWNTRVHGLTQADTENAPVFSVVWENIEPLIQGLPLVAHNKAFDERCLKAAFRVYRMDYPDYTFHCSYRAAQKAVKTLVDYKLHTVAAYCGFDLQNHHHALYDAEACAQIALKIMTETNEKK